MTAHPGYKILRRARPRHRLGSRWFVLAQLIAGVVLGFGIFDRVLMPLVVRQGSDETVPDLAKRSRLDGERAIEQSHLRVGRVAEVADMQSRKGEIIAQEPPPGAKVRRNRLVNLVVSQGPPVRLVPDLTGKTPRSASIALSQFDLRIGGSLIVPSLSIPEGEVIGTRPAHGESPGGSGIVDLLISGGGRQDLFLMPDLIGLGMDEALSRMRAAGIDVFSSSGGARTVRRQNPPPGAPIRSGGMAQID